MRNLTIPLLILLPSLSFAGNQFMEQDLSAIQSQNQQTTQSLLDADKQAAAEAAAANQQYDANREQMQSILAIGAGKASLGQTKQSAAPQKQQPVQQVQKPQQFTTPQPQATTQQATTQQSSNQAPTGFDNGKQQSSGWDYGL